MPSFFYPFFFKVFSLLKEKGIVKKKFRGINDNLLLALDGTQYHSSEKIFCKQCTVKVSKKSEIKKHSHTVLKGAFVAPGQPSVIPVAPEFITPQDGSKKQDCEAMAAKRWVEKNAPYYVSEKVTILGDDLFSRKPFCLLLLEKGFNFILVAKETSHKYLYKTLASPEKAGLLSVKKVTYKKGKKRFIHCYTYANNLPLNESDDAPIVNWCRIEIINPDKKTTYKNTFVTNHPISDESVEQIIKSGRARWKIENETINTLKTKGYNIEHNYGHGEENLSSVLLTLALLAFTFHSAADFACSFYKNARDKLGPRRRFFEHVRSLTFYHVFSSWKSLFLFMVQSIKGGDPPIEKFTRELR